MYKIVRQGESSLQYRILPQEDNSVKIERHRRLKRNRIACVLIVSLIIGCVTVAAAVIIPILLTTNIVALPAKYQTFAFSTKHGKYNIPGTQFIAILPVKEAHFKEIKIFQASETSHRGANQTEKARALLLSGKEDWPSLPAWKAVGVYKLVIIAVSVVVILIIFIVIVKRRTRHRDDQEIGWDLQGNELLSDAEDD
ncbi:uncharacterized protein LOC106661038 [Cimex lectularius]|uniref:Uncharacterized protein n=1 Tax=Cimex lectularius TaxID=79782 RepID=A0A8I6R652_CIMLE|nr:uncharacterized protein LOC106661038 [Cimex lectularius]